MCHYWPKTKLSWRIDLGKLIVAKGFKKLPKVHKIAQSGHTGQNPLPQVLKYII